MNPVAIVPNPSSQGELTIQYRFISELKFYPRSARKYTNLEVRQLADSIRAFGYTNPVLIDPDDTVIAGDRRLRALESLGIARIPTICLDSLSEDQIRAYVLADNKIQQNAGWNKSILSIELQHLIALDCAELDVTITGFAVAEIDLIIQESKGEEATEDAPEPPSNQVTVTQAGDLWHLGKHSILCGNALTVDTYRRLMGVRRAAIVFCDPPFNVAINGHVSGNGSIRHREFAMASGEMRGDEFPAFLSQSFGLLVEFSKAGSLLYICIDWRHVADLITAGSKNHADLLNICVWVKDCPGMGSLYRSQHEMIVVFRKGKQAHRNNIQLGRYGRNRSNVWPYPGINTLSKQSDEGNLLALHPTVKPIAMVADAILDCTTRGDIVLDAFLGSGTTLMAAERVGRVCCGIEIDPTYVDVAIRRWQNHTGQHAVHSASGKTFNEMTKIRDYTDESK